MKYRVVVSTPVWRLNGVNVHALNLLRGLRDLGVESEILLTNPDVPDNLAPMEFPSDMQWTKLSVPERADWPARWRCMIEHLEHRSPCIYLPNFDWEHSCVSPALSNEIGVVGIIHSDDPVRWYPHVARMAPYWNALVAVSNKIAGEFKSRHPELADRLTVISHGVATAPHLPARDYRVDAPLQLVYAGRLAQEQKRVFDLPRIMDALLARGTTAKLSIIGGGPDDAALRERCRDLETRGVIHFLGILPNAMTMEVLERADVLLLTSEYEGLPVILLEAMGRGCVPVVTDIASGIPEVIRRDRNGLLVPVGDINAFAERLALLQKKPGLRQRLAEQAYHTVRQGGFRIEDMTARYAELFERVLVNSRSGLFRRPNGSIVPPPSLSRNRRWKRRLSGLLRVAHRR